MSDSNKLTPYQAVTSPAIIRDRPYKKSSHQRSMYRQFEQSKMTTSNLEKYPVKFLMVILKSKSLQKELISCENITVFEEWFAYSLSSETWV